MNTFFGGVALLAMEFLLFALGIGAMKMHADGVQKGGTPNGASRLPTSHVSTQEGNILNRS